MSHPTDPYEPVDDHTVMRPPRRYGEDGGAGPGGSGAPAPGYASPHAQAPYDTDPYGTGGRRGPGRPGDPHATLPPADTGATWPPAGTAPGYAPPPPPPGAPAGPHAHGAPYGTPTAPYATPSGPAYGAPDDATVVPGPPGPPSDPYGFSPYATPPGHGSRKWLVPVLAGVGAFVVVAGGLGVWLAVRDDAPPAPEPTTAEQAPATDAPVEPEATEEPEPTEEPVDTDVTDDEPWLEQQYRAGAEMDPESGPALAPMSWDYFSDNDYLVNEDRIALVARRDFACDDLPAIPAIEALAGSCQAGFEARVVSDDGPTLALDLVLVDVGSEEEAERAAAAFSDAPEGDPLADTTGPAHPTLAAAVPQPGFQGTYALLDDGDSPGVMLNTGTVVMLYRLGIDDGLERDQILPVAQAVGFVITDHELAKSFGEKKWLDTKAG
ncbi:hypothetical protein FB00_00760 [Cellulosimicrobium funkei]|uniref:Uncharacterized protein n=1 Tax=Cellulosimicrobium funkei TaxID=264251 RepID=A0A0H2KX12_9MICO|nr:hypothetical protein [Cellulosimicrobium funkei]KLN36414.1 hypothetical protein FB00_00760 [Cellulosimicrobium funkei]